MSSIEKYGKKYLVRYYLYENGKRLHRKKVLDKLRDARAFATGVDASINAGKYVEAKGLTVGQWASDWFETYCTNWRDNTKADAKNSIEKHITPMIGNVRMDVVNQSHIQKFCNQLAQTEYKPAKYKEVDELKVMVAPAKIYSPKSIHNIYGLLYSAFAKAMELHIIRDNPCTGVKLPEVKVKECVIPTTEQLLNLLDELKHMEVYPAVLTCALLGTRRGESVGLYETDIDFVLKAISFQRALIINALTGQVEIGDLKTKKSHRVLPLSDELSILYKGLIAQKIAKAKEHPDTFIKSPFLFVNENGEPFRPDSLSQALTRAAARVGLKGMRLHDLRHTVATYLIDSGESAKTVQEFLGHADASFTMRRYVHGLDESKRRASNTIAKRFTR